jgi:hypothetical protein
MDKNIGKIKRRPCDAIRNNYPFCNFSIGSNLREGNKKGKQECKSNKWS